MCGSGYVQTPRAALVQNRSMTHHNCCHVCCLLALAGSGCNEPRQQTGLELVLQEVSSAEEYHRVPAFVGARRSQYGANGLYVEARLRRGSGAVAEIMLDVPYAGSTGAMAKPRASYVERLGGQVIF